MVYVTSCLSLNNPTFNENKVITIYPNPTNSVINVEFVTLSGVEADKYKIEILNSLGQVLQTANPQQPITAISVKELPSGMYQLKISEGSTQKVIKFIKN